MLKPDTLKVIDQGHGFLIGEVQHKSHPQFKYMKEGCLVTLFDGVDTALEFVKEKMPQPKRRGASANVADGWDDFNSFTTYEECMEVFSAKPETIVKFNPAELRIKDESEIGNNVEYEVVGDYIDMGRFMEGVPESMGSMHNGNARNRRVNITINLTNAGNISERDIVHRSERVLRLVDALEAGGIRCQIVGVEGSECSHTEVVLKHHDEPLTVSDLAVVTHPEFLRRIIFRISEHSKTWEGGYGSGIALSDALTPKLAQAGSQSVNEMDILIDGNMRYDIDGLFDKLERLLVWEMGKPVPEVDAIKLGRNGIYFEANGARSEAEIQREGKEAINNEG